MPWDELKPRQFPAFDKELDGISKQTMEDHYKLYEGYAKKANECRKVLNEFDYSKIEGNQVYSELRAVSVDYTLRAARLQEPRPVLRAPRRRRR
jgi:superoxide dismutase, Fe-Mn family